MKKSIFLFAILVIIAVFISCDIQKRIYRPGYLITWKASKKTAQAPPEEHATAKNTRDSYQAMPSGFLENPVKDEMLLSARDRDRKGDRFPFLVKENTGHSAAEGCDTIVFRNGMQIKAKVTDITQTETRYKYCDNPEGPTFIKANSEIKLIKHSNGSITELSISEAAAQNFAKEAANKQTQSASGKSQLTALILCILVGIIGVHRFYLGYTGIGILMLCTLGCCGIFTLVDLIRIITGDLKPKDGEYSERL